MSSAPVLITGGAGFIGSNLADRLLRLGQRVRILDNLSRRSVEANLHWLRDRHPGAVEAVVGDVRNPSAVRDAVRGVSSVFHFAAQVAVTTSLDDPMADFAINAAGTLQVLEAVRALPAPVPLLYTSTNKVYGSLGDVMLRAEGHRYVPTDPGLASGGIPESRALEFHSPYGCSKGAADQYVLDYAKTFGLPAIVFRMSCIYGPRQFGNEDQGWVAHFLLRALRGEPITVYGDGMQVRDLLFVDDLIDAMLLARQAHRALAGRAFNIGGGPANTLSLLELLERLEALHGARPAVAFEPWRMADQRYYVSDTGAFTQATGWRPSIGISEGLAKLWGWLQALAARPAEAEARVA
jgi:CDP-paratose 2-epimerase